jgi:L-fucose isomerase-like protein
MFGDYKLVLGYAPTRRDGFPDKKNAISNKVSIDSRIKEIIKKIGNVELVDIDWLNDEGMLVETEDVAKVVKHFENAGVDAIFMPHTNFGQEVVVAELGKAMNKPFLLWGPRDATPPLGFGPRQTDTQCGLFVSGKALYRYGVPFTYIENCWLDSPILEKGLDDFIRVATVIKKFRALRIGQMSLRPRQFTSVIFNESELLEKFGIEVIPIDSAEILSKVDSILKNNNKEVNDMLHSITRKVDCSAITNDQVNKIVAVELAFLELAKCYNLDSFASDCWTVIPKNLGISCCFAFGDLTEKGLPVACENDLLGSISSILLTAAARNSTPSFIADLTIRHPENDNAELLWHCGPFPSILAKEGCKLLIDDCHGQWEMKGGDITVARFDGCRGKYSLFTGEAKGVEGPSTNGNYVWIETDNWAKWEKKLVEGPYVHHVAGIHGKYKHILGEACKYMGNVEIDYV